MPNNRLTTAATQLSAAFVPAEKAQLDAAILAARSLVLALEMPERAGLHPQTGAKAITVLARGAAIAAEARQMLIEAHAEFASAAKEIGLFEEGWGCTGECPKLEGGKQNVHELPRVAAAA